MSIVEQPQDHSEGDSGERTQTTEGSPIPWRHLLRSVPPSKEDLKRLLPPLAVCHHAGLYLTDQGSRYVGQCVSCGDQDHFAIFGEALDRCGCWKCGFSGDVFSLIAEIHGVDVRLDFAKVLDVARDLVAEIDGRDLQARHHRGDSERTTTDAPSIDAYLQNCHRRTPSPVLWWGFLQRKGFPLSDLMWLWERFSLREDGSYLIAPYFDAVGKPVTYKRRHHREGHWAALKGGRLSNLYGVWLDESRPHVFLCEGESDTWATSRVFKGRADVLGLPAGAGSYRSEWLSAFHSRHVILVLDGDEVGRRAARAWKDRLAGVADEVIDVALPRSHDAADFAARGELEYRIMRRGGVSL